MSNIIVEEGYPADYHLGISMIFWLIYIFTALTLGIILLSQARKTPLLNRKELYVSNCLFFFGQGSGFILIQIGVFFPVYFILLLHIANLIVICALIFFFYFWEKNIIKLKYIPTSFMVFIFSLDLINLIFLLITGNLIYEYYALITTLLISIGILFIFILLLLFIKRVIGVLRTMGIMYIIAIVFLLIGVLIDHPPLIMFYPTIFVFVSPIAIIIGTVAMFFALKGICDGITSYYNQTQICTIHRGKISKGTHIYFCPNCNTIYCQKCYEQVIKKDGCWNCQEGVKPEDEDKWEHEVISKIEVRKGFKKKQPK